MLPTFSYVKLAANENSVPSVDVNEGASKSIQHTIRYIQSNNKRASVRLSPRVGSSIQAVSDHLTNSVWIVFGGSAILIFYVFACILQFTLLFQFPEVREFVIKQFIGVWQNFDIKTDTASLLWPHMTSFARYFVFNFPSYNRQCSAVCVCVWKRGWALVSLCVCVCVCMKLERTVHLLRIALVAGRVLELNSPLLLLPLPRPNAVIRALPSYCSISCLDFQLNLLFLLFCLVAWNSSSFVFVLIIFIYSQLA